MKEVSRLITQKLETMVDAADPDAIYSKHKAITAFFLHAARQDGRHEMFDTFLRAARTSAALWGFMWYRVRPPITTLFDGKVPPRQAAILALPYFPWRDSRNDEHFVQLWAAAIPTVPYTNEVVRSVADTLLQISSNGFLRPHIPIDIWSWLNECPFLPPICAGRYWGRSHGVVQTVRSLGDAQILTSYLVLVWSEWEYLEDENLLEMCTLIREDFGGIWMERYRMDLLRHLDHVLEQLDLGPEYLQQYDPRINEDDTRRRKDQYMELKEVLLEVERGAIDSELVRESPGSATIFGLLTPVDRHGMSLDIHVCDPSHVSVVAYPGYSCRSRTPLANRVRFTLRSFIMQFFPRSFRLPRLIVDRVGCCDLLVGRFFRFREVCVLRFGMLWILTHPLLGFYA